MNNCCNGNCNQGRDCPDKCDQFVGIATVLIAAVWFVCIIVGVM